MISIVKKKVLAALEEMGAKPTFRKILEALAEEAFKAVQRAEALIVHPDDRDTLSDWARAKGLALETDAELHLGIRIVGMGGRRSVENSLPQRLERGWDTLISNVATRFWGESGQVGRSPEAPALWKGAEGEV